MTDRTTPTLSSEILAAFAVEPGYERQVDLMMSVHPDEKRDLSELEERAADYVALLAPEATINSTDEFGKALALWKNAWPNWRAQGDRRDQASFDTTEDRWRFLLAHCSPISAAYLFRPHRVASDDERQQVNSTYRAAFAEVNRRAEASNLAGRQLIWTTSLLPSPDLRCVFEELAGLNPSAKSRLGINGQDVGFLRRYVTAHDVPFEELVTPRQFEEVVAELYRAEGWHCTVTRYSKDDGVDIQATRDSDGEEIAVLIQAKCYRSIANAKGRPRPVGLDEIKSFAATVRADEAGAGAIVSSSYFTRDGLKWASTKGMNVAQLSFLNGTGVRDRLHAIVRDNRSDQVASFVINLTS